MTESSLGITVRRPHVKIDVLFEGVIKMDEFARRFVEDTCGQEYVLVEHVCRLNESGPKLVKDSQQKLVSNLKSGLK